MSSRRPCNCYKCACHVKVAVQDDVGGSRVELPAATHLVDVVKLHYDLCKLALQVQANGLLA